MPNDDDRPVMGDFRIYGAFDRKAWLAAETAWHIKRRRAVEFAALPANQQPSPQPSVWDAGKVRLGGMCSSL